MEDFSKVGGQVIAKITKQVEKIVAKTKLEMALLNILNLEPTTMT